MEPECKPGTKIGMVPIQTTPIQTKGRGRSDIRTRARVIIFQLIGRVSADPDLLPRRNDFGLNVAAFIERHQPSQCPPAFLPLAALCCDLDADQR